VSSISMVPFQRSPHKTWWILKLWNCSARFM
jgi:hypothetical protein